MRSWWALAVALAALTAGVVLFLRFRGSDELWLTGRSLRDLKRLVDARGVDPLVCIIYGEKLARNNRAQEALDAYQRAFQMLDRDQHDALALRIAARMGYQLAVLGDDERAALYLDRASRIDKDYWLVGLGRGVTLLNQHDTKHGLAACQRAVSVRSQSYEAHYYLALAENDEKDFEDAERELTRAVAIAPEFAPTHAELGREFARRSEYTRAAEQIREARRLDPGNAGYLFGLAKVLTLSAQSHTEYREAAALQEECLKSSPGSARLLLALGQLHLRFMNLAEAYRCLKQAYDINPNELDTIYTFAHVAELWGDRARAREAYIALDHRLSLRDASVRAEKRVAAHATDPRAHLEFARCLHAAGDLNGAYTQLNDALTLRPGLTQAQAEMKRMRSELEQLMDHPDEAKPGADDSSASRAGARDDAQPTEAEKPVGSVP